MLSAYHLTLIFKLLKMTKKDQQKEILKKEKQAIKWFETNFKAVFGGQTICTDKGKVTWHYTTGILIFGFPKLGDYHYEFVMEIIDLQQKKDVIFNDGFAFGRCVQQKTIESHKGRDSNPYERDNENRKKWDAGYISGLSNFILPNTGGCW